MTPEQLAEIAHAAKEWEDVPFVRAYDFQPGWLGDSQRVNALLTLAKTHVPALLAEIYRLRTQNTETDALTPALESAAGRLPKEESA